MTNRLTADDFLTGLLAGLVIRGETVISIQHNVFDSAVKAVFDTLWAQAGAKDLDLVFRVRPDRIHGDSPTVRAAIDSAVQRDLVSLDNPEYQDMRFKFGRNEAELLLTTVPGGRDVFLPLADHFLKVYGRQPLPLG